MYLWWGVGGAVAGLPIGTVLRGPVFRWSVPSGAPDRVTCPHCAAPVRFWLAARCGHCRRRLGTPAALELATAAVLGVVLGRFGGQLETAAFGFFGVVGVTLAAIDIAVQRLPDRLTLPAFPVLLALLAVPAVAAHDAGELIRAVLGGAVLAASFLVLALLRPGQLGGGDIKLAGLAGLMLGWLGWPTLLVGAALGFVLSAVASLALLAAGRVTLRSAVCFGPFLLGGALLAILVSAR